MTNQMTPAFKQKLLIIIKNVNVNKNENENEDSSMYKINFVTTFDNNISRSGSLTNITFDNNI